MRELREKMEDDRTNMCMDVHGDRPRLASRSTTARWGDGRQRGRCRRAIEASAQHWHRPPHRSLRRSYPGSCATKDEVVVKRAMHVNSRVIRHEVALSCGMAFDTWFADATTGGCRRRVHAWKRDIRSFNACVQPQAYINDSKGACARLNPYPRAGSCIHTC